MGAVRFGPACVPSRERAAAAVEVLVERRYRACEIDFGSGFWMDRAHAEQLGKRAGEAGIVLSMPRRLERQLDRARRWPCRAAHPLLAYARGVDACIAARP